MPSDSPNIPFYLNQWFQEHEQLIIPELGHFKSRYKSAQLQVGINKVLPPNKEIIFDSQNKGDDSAFAQFIAQAEGIDSRQAAQEIQAFVNTLKAELGAQKECEVENFGRFIWTPQGDINFQNNDEVNYASESFGLPDLYNLKPALKNVKGGDTELSTYPQTTSENTYEEREEELEQELDHDVVFEKGVERNRSNFLSTALLVILSVVILSGIVLLTLDVNPFPGLIGSKNDSEEINEENQNEEIDPNSQDLVDANDNNDSSEENSEDNSESDNAEPVDDPPLQNNDDSAPKLENPPIDFTVSNNFVNSFTYLPQVPANVSEITVSQASGKHYVILGSFSNRENAYSYVNNLLRNNIRSARIIPPNTDSDKYRVAYQGFSSRKEAREKGRVFAQAKQLSYFILQY